MSTGSHWPPDTRIAVLYALLLALTATVQAATPVLVSIQTQDQASMDALTRAIDDISVSGTGGADRVMLGAIEATASRVVDVDNPTLATMPETVPTLSLLDTISYDSAQHTWTLSYRTSRVDGTGRINSFRRHLYTSKLGAVETGDTHNPCLVQGVDNAACLDAMKTAYVISPSATPDADTLRVDEAGIGVTVDDVEHTMQQIITITIPHEAIYNELAQREAYTHPVDGERVQYSFGIGMLFTGAANNIVFFDNFHLVEVSNQLVSVDKSNSYSIARHVSFWTSQIESIPSIYIATIEYTLDDGHLLETIDATVNHRPIAAACARMRDQIRALNSSACLTRYPLCTPVTYTTGEGAGLRTWATLVLPVELETGEEEVAINTLLTTNDTRVSPPRQGISTLNFATRQHPQQVCRDAKVTSFDPVSYTTADLYRGTAVAFSENVAAASYFSVHNDTGDTALSMAESLLTLVLRPTNDDAVQYMSRFTDEKIRLDDLYMSHASVEGVLPSTVHNTLHSVAMGRSEITVDPALLAVCPREVAGGSWVYETGFGSAADCVTTHDWAAGSYSRFASAPEGMSFVFRVDTASEETATAWLQSTLTGESDAGAAAAAQIYARAISRVESRFEPYSAVYWLWPVYYWPDKSPVGLKDRTLISLSWSLTQASTVHRRRLLGTGDGVVDLDADGAVNLDAGAEVVFDEDGAVDLDGPESRPSQKNHTLVVAVCDEDVAWVDEWASRFTEVVVFSKCGRELKFESDSVEVIELPNIGGNDKAYLTYIVDCYNSLPERVTFAKGTLCTPDKPGLSGCARMFHGRSTHPFGPKCQSINADPKRMMQFSIGNRMSPFDQYHPKNNKKQTHRFIKSKYDNMGHWVDEATLLTRQMFEGARAEPILGGYFTVDREQIRNAPRDVYVNLKEQQTAPNEEVDHFIERAWSTLFCSSDADMRTGVAMKRAKFGARARIKQRIHGPETAPGRFLSRLVASKSA